MINVILKRNIIIIYIKKIIYYKIKNMPPKGIVATPSMLYTEI